MKIKKYYKVICKDCNRRYDYSDENFDLDRIKKFHRKLYPRCKGDFNVDTYEKNIDVIDHPDAEPGYDTFFAM